MKIPSLLFAGAARGAVACCVLLSRLTFAAEFEQHPPHVHGKVTLNAALDGNQLVIELESPAINVVGFEHEPRNDAERAAVRAAAKLLENGRALFALPSEARCQFQKTDLKAPQWEPSVEDTGQHEEHEQGAEHGRHADYEARFSYQCWAPEHLTWLQPALLDKLRNVTEARLNIATARGQQSEVATSGHARVAIQ